MQLPIIRDLGITNYAECFKDMLNFISNRDNSTRDEIWLTQHQAVYTVGKSEGKQHILNPQEIARRNIKIIKTDRGGKITYHSEGQLVLYPLLNIYNYNFGLKKLIFKLEQSVIDTLAEFKLIGHRVQSAPGVYINNKKIAQLGLKFTKHYSYHGISLNIEGDLTPFQYINPCGYKSLEIINLTDMLCHKENKSQIFRKIQNKLVDNFLKHIQY